MASAGLMNADARIVCSRAVSCNAVTAGSRSCMSVGWHGNRASRRDSGDNPASTLMADLTASRNFFMRAGPRGVCCARHIISAYGTVSVSRPPAANGLSAGSRVPARSTSRRAILPPSASGCVLRCRRSNNGERSGVRVFSFTKEGATH